jgi:outer membrane receptor protein involved in Fe transport
MNDPWHVVAGWVQDTWKATSQLTLTLGARYDFSTSVIGEGAAFTPSVSTDRSSDRDLAPRLGGTYSLNRETVIRGGRGKYSRN